MLLTDDEIHEDYKALRGDKQPRYIEIYRAAEAAILAKLGAMELPSDAWDAFIKNECSAPEFTAAQLHQAYAQGAAAQLAHKPMGWFVKEHGDVVDLEWNSEKPKYEGDWKPLYTRREA